MALSIALVALAVCVIGLAIVCSGLAERLTRAEQALETSVRAHERHAARNVELCDRMGRFEKLSRERSRRIRGRVYILERQRSDRFRSVAKAMASGLIRLGDPVAQNEDGTVRSVGKVGS